MALKISNTANSANSIVFPSGMWDMQASPVVIRIFCVFNTTPAASNRLMCKNISAAGTRSWGIKCLSSALVCDWYQGTVNSTISGTSTFGVGLPWNDIVLVYDSSKAAGEYVKLYTNGALELDNNGVVGNPDTNAVAFSIGKDQQTGSNAAPIDVAEVEVYAGTLSAAEVAQLYNGGNFKRLQDIGKIVDHYYPMLGDETTTITDQVGSANLTGNGVTNAGRHPPMWYLDTGGGFRSRSRTRFRGR